MLAADDESLAEETQNPKGGSTTSNMTPLAEDFEPGIEDVICGRGKKCYTHIGNERFRDRVFTFLDEYSLAKSKLDKSGVLSKVVDEVRHFSPRGGFVKQDAHGRWHEVGDFLAREKTSQAFRDALHDRYKSSNLSKKKRRQAEQAKVSVNPYAKMGRSEFELSPGVERLSNKVLGSQGLLTLDSFNRSNFELLTRLNRMSGRNQSLYPESNRRYSSNPAPDYMQRSMGTLSEHHFPDPLFGSAINAANAMPSDFEREKLSTEGFRERAHSISSSNTDYAAMPTEYDRQKLSTEASYRDRSQSLAQNTPYFSRQQLPSAHQDVKAYHQSLSDFGFNDNDMFDEDVAMHHQSLPDFAMSMPAQFGSERIKHSQDDDPIPFRHIRMPGRKHIKTTGECVELNKPPRPQSIDELQISMSQAAKYSTGKISKDLMECLDKMTYHNLSDDNPFEPVPLAPQQEKAHALQKQTAAARTNPHEETTPVDAFGDNPLLDESECDEFAEA